LFALTGVIYFLPRFSGRRRRVAAYGLLGVILVLTGAVLEFEYATWFEFVQGSTISPMLWRLTLLLGLGVLLLTAIRVVRTWRGQGCGVGWRGVAQKGHGVLIAASCLTVVCLSAFWAAV
jgi:hypothetical protein